MALDKAIFAMENCCYFSYFSMKTYHIQPNYCTVHFSFSTPVLRVHLKKKKKKKKQKKKTTNQQRTNLMMLIQCLCVCVFLIFFIHVKAYVVGTHLNCLNLSNLVEAIQMSTNKICFYKEGDKKRTWAAIW